MTFVICHGTKGSPDSNWFPWLASKLEKLGHQTIRPTFPTPTGQNLASWLTILDQSIGREREDLMFIGHSSSPLVICHWLSQPNHQAKAAFFAAPFAQDIGIPEYDTLNREFYKTLPNWFQVRLNCPIVKIFAGNNDPYVPLSITQQFAHNLSTEVIIIPNGGHLGSVLPEFPKLLQEIKGVIQ